MMDTIPPITDPMGRYWDQPSPDDILIIEDTAFMSEENFQKLSNYSASVPSGVYDGKMWKSNPHLHWPEKYQDVWWLRWYAPSVNDPKCCSIVSKRIYIS